MMEITSINVPDGPTKPMTGTVRSIKRKKFKQTDTNINNNNKLVIPCSCSDQLLNETIPVHLPKIWNISGWIRVYCGPYRDVIDYEEPSRMVHVMSNATTSSIIQDMDVPMEYTLWVHHIYTNYPF